MQAVARVIHDKINPFQRSLNSRIFDMNTTPVIPVHATRRLTLTSDANGHGAIAISPSWASSYFEAPTISVANVVTAWGTATSGSFYSASNYDHYRVVSMGVRVMSIVSATNSSGMVTVGVLKELPSGGVDLTKPQDFSECKTVPLYQADLTLLSEPTGIEALSTLDIATSAADLNGWTVLVVSVDGVPASTASLVLEVCHNFEVIPLPGGGHTHYAHDPAPHSNVIETVASSARKALGAITDNKEHPFVAGAENAAIGATAYHLGSSGATASAAADTAVGVAETTEAITAGEVIGDLALALIPFGL